MSLTFSRTQGNGTTLSYPIVASGGYFKEEDIIVELILIETGEATEQTLGTDYTISNDNVVFVTAPTSLYYVRVRRKVSDESTYSTFAKGNAFGKDNLNNSFLQALYQLQQLADGFRPDDFYWKADTNAAGNKLTNLGEGTEDTDAVNYGQVASIVSDIEAIDEKVAAAAGSAEDAATSATAAASSATQSSGFANDSSTYANASSDSATASATSATESADSATTAATYATNSADSATESAASATEAATTAETTATTVATQVSTDIFSRAGMHPADYGAAGDGTTDDIVALQDCIDAAAAADVPVILSKFHKISDNLDIPGGLSILGHSKDTCGFKIYEASFNTSGADGVLVLESGASDAIRLENFSISTDMDTSVTSRSALTDFPPCIYASGAPRFSMSNIRLNACMIGVDATNAGGPNIIDCEIGAYEKGIILSGTSDYIFIDRLELAPFGISGTASEAIYQDGDNYGIYATDVDMITFGTIAAYCTPIWLDGCLGTISSLHLDGIYARLQLRGTNRAGDITIGNMYKSTDDASDIALFLKGTYGTNLSIGAMNLTFETALTSTGMILINQSDAEVSITNLIADITGETTRLVYLYYGKLNLTNVLIKLDDATADRTKSLFYISRGYLNLDNLRAPTMTGSAELLDIYKDYNHSLSNIIAPGWTLDFPSTADNILISNVHTATDTTADRLTGAIKRYYLEETCDSSGTAEFTPPYDSYTQVTHVAAFIDQTTWKATVATEKIAIGNNVVRVTTGETGYSGVTCYLFLDCLQE